MVPRQPFQIHCKDLAFLYRGFSCSLLCLPFSLASFGIPFYFVFWTAWFGLCLSLVERLLLASDERIPDPELCSSAPHGVLVIARGVFSSSRVLGYI